MDAETSKRYGDGGGDEDEDKDEAKTMAKTRAATKTFAYARSRRESNLNNLYYSA